MKKKLNCKSKMIIVRVRFTARASPLPTTSDRRCKTMPSNISYHIDLKPKPDRTIAQKKVLKMPVFAV